MKHIFAVIAFVLITEAASAQQRAGNSAPDISLPDANGQILKLSSLQGKVVLLDFWASWCGPCRRSFPHTLSVYNQYKDKGFEVYGVSIDENVQAWQNAVKQDQTLWKQVIDTKAGFGNELTKTWDIKYIPSSFLIDKEGKIAIVAPSNDELEKYLKKSL